MRFRKGSPKGPEVPQGGGSAADDTPNLAEFKRLMVAAENEDRVAQYKLGRIFLRMGREFDAMNYFRYSVYRGYEPAWLEIGAMCGKARGVAGTHEDIANWYRPAAAEGSATAQFALAGLYRMGLGVEPDPVECTRLYRLAAEQGNPDAQYWLSGRYRDGAGVRRDVQQHLKWLHRAAEGDQRSAQFELGVRYLHGSLVEQDVDRGIQVLTKTGNAGHWDSITALASAYLTGKVCPVNLGGAAKWIEKFVSHSTAESAQEYARGVLLHSETPTGTSPEGLLIAHILYSLAREAGQSSGAKERRLVKRRLSAGALRKSRAVTRLCLQAARTHWSNEGEQNSH